MFKIIKSIFIFIGIAAVVLAIYLIYQGNQYGSIKNFLMNKAANTVLDTENLSETQKEYLEEGDYESLVKDVEQNVTPEQIDCATQAVGEERAKELLETKDPTPQEMLKLSKCL